MYGAVFKTENLVTGKLYIGQTITDRKYYIGSGSYFLRSVKKHGKESFKRINLKSCNCQEDLNFWEKHYITLYNSLVPNEYNLDLGGNGVGKCSLEHKRKMSEVMRGRLSPMLGRHHTEDTKKKISKTKKEKYQRKNHPMYGKKHSVESIRKMSEVKIGKNNSRFGKHHTVETKKKMSEAASGEKNHNFGKHHTEEHKRKMSEVMGGRIFTEESKKKMSEAMKKSWQNRKNRV